MEVRNLRVCKILSGLEKNKKENHESLMQRRMQTLEKKDFPSPQA